jgi:hypothetical protein
MTLSSPDTHASYEFWFCGYRWGFSEYVSLGLQHPFTVMQLGPAGSHIVPVSALQGWAIVAAVPIVLPLLACLFARRIRLQRARERPG